MEALFKDIRYGMRSLLNRPGFTAVTVITLALGIGANWSIFTVVSGVFLRPLPYGSSSQLVSVCNQIGTTQLPLSQPEFRDYKDQVKDVEDVAGISDGDFSVTGNAMAERVRGAFVTPNLFQTLEVSPNFGRTFVEEEHTEGKNHVVILSDSLWKRRFGADSDIVGRQIQIERTPYLVVGIMPAQLRLPEDLIGTERTELWIPLVDDPTLSQQRNFRFIQTIARLRPGGLVGTSTRRSGHD
jgi:putative ABC transport system permease protein